MLNVWDWIAECCHAEGWHSSANVAEFLAGQDREMYGNRVTEEWKIKGYHCDIIAAVSCKPANFLVAVARFRDFKVGCVVSGYVCEECESAKKQGKCNSAGSISHFWQYVLEQDSGETVDKELQKEFEFDLDRV